MSYYNQQQPPVGVPPPQGGKPLSTRNSKEESDCLKEDNVIGSGASGKAVLSNGKTVAVKKLSKLRRPSNSKKS
ncbi:hypothetical protein OIU78_025502 [Salix suchowensis]|nr:hypothetical protein OIU78_025502 [Salix suchowensis]